MLQMRYGGTGRVPVRHLGVGTVASRAIAGVGRAVHARLVLRHRRLELGDLHHVAASILRILLSLAVPVSAEHFAATHVVVAITATERVVCRI
jgi:hypothetical protein